MHVVIAAGPFVPVPPKKYGGIELVIGFLIKGLRELGHEVTLLAPGDSTSDCEIIPIVDKALYFPRHKSERPEHQKLAKTAADKTEKILRSLAYKADIIHSHGVDLKNFADVPNITTLHNPMQIQDLAYFLARKELFYASISENQQAAIPELKYAGVVYNGEDPSAFPFVEQPEDYVCFLGRFDREKNPHLAIQLALALGKKIKIAGKVDAHGDGYFQEEIEPYLNNPLVEYLGEIGFEEKVALLSNAKCNLHPTGFREPFGLTVLEAAYCGTPTLAINRGSMPELIELGRTGELVEDFIEGFHAIQSCFEMDRRYIANRSRMLFNYKNMAKDYVKAYKKVIRHYKSAHVSAILNRKPTMQMPSSVNSTLLRV